MIPTAPGGSRSSASRPPKATKAAAVAAARTAAGGRDDKVRFTTETQRHKGREAQKRKTSQMTSSRRKPGSTPPHLAVGRVDPGFRRDDSPSFLCVSVPLW